MKIQKIMKLRQIWPHKYYVDSYGNKNWGHLNSRIPPGPPPGPPWIKKQTSIFGEGINPTLGN